jgi:Na+/proline symporter
VGAVPQKSLIGKVLLQMSGVGAYFALVVILYWRELTNAGAVALIVGLLFIFKAVVDSGAISIGHLSPSDPEFDIGSPGTELLSALSFLGVGMGAWVDLTKAMQTGLVPPYLPAAVIHLMLVCSFAIFVACCFARLSVALKNRPRR